MRYVKFLSVLFVTLLAASACKKEYSCYCRKGGREYNYSEKFSSKAKADDWCRAKIPSQDTVYCDIVN